MSLRLSVVSPRAEAAARGDAMRIAFATTDLKHIDQHFGSTEAFALFAVTAESHEFLEAIRFAGAAQDGNEDKLVERMNALAGCAAVYVQAVGSSAIQRLLSSGVQPVKIAPGTPIAEALAALKLEIQVGTTPWIARALSMRKDPSRFAAMSAEEWDE